MVNLYIEYEVYDRVGGNKRHAHIKGNDLYDCVYKMYDNMNLYGDGDSMDDNFNEAKGEDPTLTRDQYAMGCIESIAAGNGDGCDYILLLKDEDSGEVYIQDFDNAVETW